MNTMNSYHDVAAIPADFRCASCHGYGATVTRAHRSVGTDDFTTPCADCNGNGRAPVLVADFTNHKHNLQVLVRDLGDRYTATLLNLEEETPVAIHETAARYGGRVREMPHYDALSLIMVKAATWAAQIHLVPSES